RLCLVAPTWRGPLPTMMPGRRSVGTWITRASDLPLLGSLLYRLNVNIPAVRMMARGHVDSDPSWLTGERLQQKMAVISAPGARYASIRFVTGMLDLISDRTSFIEMAKGVKDPILVRRGGRRRKWKPSRPFHTSNQQSCHLASLLCMRNFPTLSSKSLCPFFIGLGRTLAQASSTAP